MEKWREFREWYRDGEVWIPEFLAELCDRVLLSTQILYVSSRKGINE